MGTVFNQYKYDFKDNQIGFIKVDQDSYDYRVDMKLNDDMQGPTGDAHSILLQRDNGIVPIVDPDTNAINLIWKHLQCLAGRQLYCCIARKSKRHLDAGVCARSRKLATKTL